MTSNTAPWQLASKDSLDLGQLHEETGRHTDFEICCGGHTFRVHKALLAAASGYFERVCSSRFQEGQAGRVQLTDVEPELVARIITFAYTGSYDNEPIGGKSKDAQIKAMVDAFADHPHDHSSRRYARRARTHAHLYSLADRFDIKTLKSQSRQRFLLAIWCQDEYSFDFNSEKALKLSHLVLSDIIDLVNIVYSTTPSTDGGLWDIVLDVLHDILYDKEGRKMNSVDPVKGYNPLEHQPLRDFLAENSDLTYDIATRIRTEKDYICSHCKGKPRVLAWQCTCGLIDGCEKDSCLQAIQQDSLCRNCLHLGTLYGWCA